MRVTVDSLTRPGMAPGLDVALTLDVDWVRAAAVEALEVAPGALSGSIRVEPPVGATRSVAIVVQAQAALVRPCDRCAEDVPLTLAFDEQLTYVPAPEHDVEEDVELEGAELDVGWYEGGVLALDDVLCEVLALGSPAKVCCADTAACDARYQALLDAARSAAAPQGHPGLAALRSILPSS